MGKPFVGTTVAGFAYLAYDESMSMTGVVGNRFKLYASAAALVGYPVNEQLVAEVKRLEFEDGGKKGEGLTEERAKELVGAWGRLDFNRLVLVVGGTDCFGGLGGGV